MIISWSLQKETRRKQKENSKKTIYSSTLEKTERIQSIINVQAIALKCFHSSSFINLISILNAVEIEFRFIDCNLCLFHSFVSFSHLIQCRFSMKFNKLFYLLQILIKQKTFLFQHLYWISALKIYQRVQSWTYFSNFHDDRMMKWYLLLFIVF